MLTRSHWIIGIAVLTLACEGPPQVKDLAIPKMPSDLKKDAGFETEEGEILETGELDQTGVRLEIGPASPQVRVDQLVELVVVAVIDQKEKRDVTAECTWQVQNPALIANERGATFRGLAPGKTKLTAACRKVTETISVDVTAATATTLKLVSLNPKAYAGEEVPFRVEATLDNGRIVDVTAKTALSINVPALANVIGAGTESPRIKTLGVGSVVVSAEFEALLATAAIEIDSARLEALEVIRSSNSLVVATTEVYRARGTFSDGLVTEITSLVSWTTKDPAIAAFDASAKNTLRALKIGETGIVVTHLGKTVEVPLKVVDPLLERVAVTRAATAALSVGASDQLRAIAYFNNGSTSDVTADAVWSSSNPQIVSVTNLPGTTGQIRAVSEGIADITAAFKGKTAALRINIEQRPVDLSLQFFGAGQGRVVSVNETCLQNCTLQRRVGETVTLRAQADPGNTFAGWAGACAQFANSQTCTLTISEGQTVGVSFSSAASSTLLQVSTPVGGLITGPNINCGSICSSSYPNNTSVTLVAKALSNYRFAGWTGACAAYGTNATCSLSVNGSGNVGANFVPGTPQQFTVTIKQSATGRIIGPNLDCGRQFNKCSAIFDQGTNVILQISLSTDTKFRGWLDDCVSSGTQGFCNFTVTRDHLVAADFGTLGF